MSVAPVLLGSQGWRFRQMNGRSSRPAVTALDMLRAYAREFTTVEVHDTFFGLPPECVLRDWRDSVPTDFLFSLTLPQQITHEGRLVGPERMLERFLERVAALGANVGPILIRLPMGFRHTTDNDAVLRAFVAALPEGYRWAAEFRSADWFAEEVLDLFRSRNVATVLPDGRFLARTMMLDLASAPTADFAYVRWNALAAGAGNGAHAGGHNEVLSRWLSALQELRAKTGIVFGYFGYRLHLERADLIRECRTIIDRIQSQPSPHVP